MKGRPEERKRGGSQFSDMVLISLWSRKKGKKRGEKYVKIETNRI